MGRILTICLLTGLTILTGPTLQAIDNGAQDTLYLIPTSIDAAGNDSLFILEAWMFNDSNEIGCQFGFEWDSDLLYLDSVIPTPDTDSIFGQVAGFRDLDAVNLRHRVYFATISWYGIGYPPRPERHHLGTFYFTVNDWDATSEITIDTTHWDDGSKLIFVAPNGSYSYMPIWQYAESPLVVQDVSVQPCCGNFTNGFTGNTDCDYQAKRNLADITRLIDRVYLSKIELCCGANGNVDGDLDGKVNLSDITQLIDHVYLSKAETATCQ